jgi:hypothetical protein
MGKINNYTVGSVKAGDKILTSDEDSGNTKNITVQSILNFERSSSVYRAYLTQTSTIEPTAVVVDGNTITGTWTYVNTGEYLFTSTGAFASVSVGCITGIPAATTTTFAFSVTSNNSVTLKTYTSGTLTNALMTGLYVEIFTHSA